MGEAHKLSNALTQGLNNAGGNLENAFNSAGNVMGGLLNKAGNIFDNKAI